MARPKPSTPEGRVSRISRKRKLIQSLGLSGNGQFRFRSKPVDLEEPLPIITDAIMSKAAGPQETNRAAQKSRASPRLSPFPVVEKPQKHSRGRGANILTPTFHLVPNYKQAYGRPFVRPKTYISTRGCPDSSTPTLTLEQKKLTRSTSRF